MKILFLVSKGVKNLVFSTFVSLEPLFILLNRITTRQKRGESTKKSIWLRDQRNVTKISNSIPSDYLHGSSRLVVRLRVRSLERKVLGSKLMPIKSDAVLVTALHCSNFFE